MEHSDRSKPSMTLGIFDSGLGGILIAKSIKAAMPTPNMVYLGDTLHVPYGNRSEAAIYNYTKNAMDFMLSKCKCALIVLACNTASASALRKLQQEYLPLHYPDRRILGVIVPTIEYAIDHGFTKLGLIGTNYTVSSNVYEEELQKINPDLRLFQTNTPLLVPLIENDGMQWIEDILDYYIEPLLAKSIEALVLSCTHYISLKNIIRERYNIPVLSQDEIIPSKLQDYMLRHPEITEKIGQDSQENFFATDVTPAYISSACNFYTRPITIQKIETP